MPKNQYSKDIANSSKPFLPENFVPFLHFQVKNGLTFGFSYISGLKEHIGEKQLFEPDHLKKFTNYTENIAKALQNINRIMDLMSLLRELEQYHLLQPQKILPEQHFLPIIEKYCRKAKIQGMDWIFNFHFSKGSLYGGKVEFEHILELLLSMVLQKKPAESIDIILDINESRMLLLINAIQFRKEGLSKNEAYQRPQEGLAIIRMHLIQKLVEKLKGSMSFEHIDEIRIEIQVKPWKIT